MNQIRRYDYLDIAKGLGILAVVWAHIMLVGWSHRVCYAFHMPLFFFISGMLFRRDKYSSFSHFMGKRSKRLLLPYLVYSILTWAVWAAFRWIRHDPVDSYWAPLLQTFIAQGSGQFMVHNSALWFIPCLFLVELLYWGLSSLKEWLNVLVCFLLCIFSFLLGRIWGSEYWLLLPFNFDAVLIALPFYCVGNLALKHYSHEDLVKWALGNRITLAIIAVVLSMVLVVLALRYGECSMGSSSYQCSGFVFVARAFVGILAFLSISLLVSSIKSFNNCFIDRLIKWFGRQSLDIMCLHIPAKGVCIVILAHFIGKTPDYISSSGLPSVIVFLLTMLAVSIVLQFIDRYIYNHR